MTAVNPLLIIHGWSDNAASFQPLVKLLQAQAARDIHLIDFADYLSMDDEITFDDLVTAMSYAWRKFGLPIKPYSVDVLVHSTGGLIIRDWLTRNFTLDTVPIKHLVMLAPANFGSPLAHKGQAFIGRIIEGFNSQKLFQVGKRLLQNLEVASPYSWELAMQDRFNQQVFYGPDKILCTVLVGNIGYTGISAAANENGGDGVVRIATANLNCALLEADFSIDPLHPTYRYHESTGLTAFAVMDGEDHNSIAAKHDSPRNELTLSNIIGGLTVDDQHFEAWCAELAELTHNVMQQGSQNNYTHGYQNSVFVVENQYGEQVADYFLEFYAPEPHQTWFSQLFHQDIITTTHAYSQNNSYRSLYLDCTLLHQQLQKDLNQLCFSLTALPEFSRNGNVGYRTFNDHDIGAITFDKSAIADLFIANQTLLTKIIIRREQVERLFNIHPSV